MEQKDYIRREIEKIGVIINFIRQKLFGGKDSLSLTIEDRIRAASAQLLEETEFNLNKFLSLDVEASNEYIGSFEGFSCENIELLADFIFDVGNTDDFNYSKIYHRKALQLYELCNTKSRTYSLIREAKIKTIKDVL